MTQIMMVTHYFATLMVLEHYKKRVRVKGWCECVQDAINTQNCNENTLSDTNSMLINENQVCTEASGTCSNKYLQFHHNRSKSTTTSTDSAILVVNNGPLTYQVALSWMKD